MSVVEDLSEEEKYLLALLLDTSGIDQAEFLWKDETNKDAIFRCYDFQYAWYRTHDKFQIDQCARSVGKSLGIQMRAFAFPFHSPGEEMLLTAPEMIHLSPITDKVADRILDTRISREMLKRKGASIGITHRPFEARFVNGSRIMGRIPQKDGKGVKGQHPKQLEMDEAQDYPEAGWVELGETLKYGNEDAIWRAHGVSRGVRDRFYKQTQEGSGWTVHRITAMHRGDWSQAERESKAELYGSRDHPDYRRNILGLHGDAQSALFVLTRLMACVDSVQSSDYNENEYHHVRITEEKLNDSGLPINALLQLPGRHQAYGVTWAGMDVGLTNHPSEILVFGEITRTKSSKYPNPEATLKLLTRVHLERISAPDQRAVMEAIWDHYRCRGFAMDRTGLGFPIYQEIMNDGGAAFQNSIRAYNFSEKIVAGYEREEQDDEVWWEEEDPEPIYALVLEYASDMLRLLVDTQRLMLPWDVELIREFQGQTYQVSRSSTNPYGRKVFSQGRYHALDAARMAATAFFQEQLGDFNIQEKELVLDSFLTA